MKKLYIHVGLPKTGTTSIQVGLKDLQRKGQLVYPQYFDLARSQTREFTNCVAHGRDALNAKQREMYWSRLVEDVKDGDSQTYALSDETLAMVDYVDKERFWKSISTLSQYCDIEFILVVRPFISWYESLINQFVKRGNLQFETFDISKAREVNRYRVNFWQIYSFYAFPPDGTELPGALSVRVLPWSKAIIEDVFQCMGLTESAQKRSRVLNESQSAYKSLERYFESQSWDPTYMPEKKDLQFLGRGDIDILEAEHGGWLKRICKETGVSRCWLMDFEEERKHRPETGYLQEMQSILRK